MPENLGIPPNMFVRALYDLITPNDSDIGSWESNVGVTTEVDDSSISELEEEFGLHIGDEPFVAPFWRTAGYIGR